MLRRAFCLLNLIALGSRNSGIGRLVPSGDFEAVINQALTPVQSSLPDEASNPQPVAACRDEAGVQTDFIERTVVLRPKSDDELIDFILRYDGVVIDRGPA